MITVHEISLELRGHERYDEFLDTLDDHDYPKPWEPRAKHFECNDQFEYFWRRVADGENLKQSYYIK